VKLRAKSNQKDGFADGSLSFKSGRSGSKIGPYSNQEANLLDKTIGNSRRADRLDVRLRRTL